MVKANNVQTNVQFERGVWSRIERAAERKFSGIQGATQSYIRFATMKMLQEDEAALQVIGSDPD